MFFEREESSGFDVGKDKRALRGTIWGSAWVDKAMGGPVYRDDIYTGTLEVGVNASWQREMK